MITLYEIDVLIKKNIWKKKDCTLLQSDDQAAHVNEKGWTKVDGISSNELEALKVLFEENHDIKDYGMFYSLYSEDLNYRKKINDGIIAALQPSLEKNFKDFKILYGVFVVKTPGKQDTEFFLHQDPSYTDEFKYSSLHFWVPLDDITMENGALCIVEGSQNISYPYRSITIPAIFEGNETEIRPFLKPLTLVKGESIVLDPRVIHNSLANTSTEQRIVALLGLIPKQAPIISAYHDPDGPKNQLELFEFEDDYFVTGRNFFQSCKCRPAEGKFLEKIEFDFAPLTKAELKEKISLEGVQKVNLVSEVEMVECKMFGEPIS